MILAPETVLAVLSSRWWTTADLARHLQLTKGQAWGVIYRCSRKQLVFSRHATNLVGQPRAYRTLPEARGVTAVQDRQAAA